MQGLLAFFSSSLSSLKFSPGLARACSDSSFLLADLSSFVKLFFNRVMEGWARPFSIDMRVHKL